VCAKLDDVGAQGLQLFDLRVDVYELTVKEALHVIAG